MTRDINKVFTDWIEDETRKAMNPAQREPMPIHAEKFDPNTTDKTIFQRAKELQAHYPANVRFVVDFTGGYTRLLVMPPLKYSTGQDSQPVDVVTGQNPERKVTR
jgi:hypothetical protein